MDKQTMWYIHAMDAPQQSKAKQNKNGAIGAGSIDTPNNLDESQRLYAE